MSKKYYETEVLIRATVRVPVDEYENVDHAIECIEMSDIEDICKNIEENNDKEYYITVLKHNAKEVSVE